MLTHRRSHQHGHTELVPARGAVHGMPHAARQGRLHRVRHVRRRCRLCLGELPAILGRRATCQGHIPRCSRHDRKESSLRHLPPPDQARSGQFCARQSTWRIREVRSEGRGGRGRGAQVGFSPRILRSTGHVVGQSTGSISHSQIRAPPR